MTGLAILLIVGFMIAYILQREIEEVLPPFVMTLLLGIYELGILKKSHHAYFLSLCCFAVIAVLFVVMLFRRRKQVTTNGQQDQNRRFDINTYMRSHAGFFVFLIVSMLIMWCYHTHFVMVWDDFHYNALFPKNCYAYGTMPVGFHSATHYKSYLPLLQLFFYWGFQGSGFSEVLMFQYKMVLIYVLILPLFRRINILQMPARIAMGVAASILPFLFMYEVQESLSMDTVMGLLFAYAIIEIVLADQRDLFCFYRIVVALLCLTLIKTIAVIFTAICIATWVVVYVVRLRESGPKQTEALGATVKNADEMPSQKFGKWVKNEWVMIAIICVLNAAAYFSWKIFCARNGNTNYLSNNLMDNLRNGKAIPEYAGETIKNILKSLFTLSTNLGPNGLSVSGVLVVGILTILILRANKQLKKTDVALAIMLVLGLIGYLMVLGYTYVFVFEQWEAESLSSLDRYLGTYAIMFCYVILYRLSLFSDDTLRIARRMQRDEYSLHYESQGANILLPVLTVVLLVTLPYGLLRDVLIPSRYQEARAQMYADRKEVHAEMEAFMAGDYQPGTFLSVNCEGNTIYDRGIDYEVLPHVSRPFNIADVAKDERQAALNERIADMEPDYIYFSAHERNLEDISVYHLPENYEPLTGVAGMYHKIR